MAETYGFYDTEELVDGSYDREYIAQQWADYFKLFIGTGVFASPTNQLKVVAGEGMNIIVKEGWAFIEGRWYHNDADLVIPVQPNTTASTITSGVFIQANSSDRVIKAVIATGRTTPDREAPYYELELAQIQLATGTTAITNSMITDMRTDESVCGFVKGLLEGVIPTADLFLQFEDTFMTWFDRVKDQLDSDAAGHLQNEIDTIQTSVENLQTNVRNLQTGVEGLENELTANSKKFQFAYDSTKRKYGYTIDDVFYPFSKGAVLIGTYSSDTTINVSAYGAESANQFLAVCDTNSSVSNEWGNGQEGSYGMGWVHASANYIAPTISLSGNTLTLTVGKYYYQASAPSGSGNRTTNLSTKLYYVGDIE